MADWPLIGVRFALFADLSLLFGVPLFGLYALRGEARNAIGVVRSRPLIVSLAAMGLGLSALGFVVLAASMSGVPIAAVDRATMRMLLFETTPGWAALVRGAALVMLFVLGLAMPRRPAMLLGLVSALAAVALASLAWSGHAAANEGIAGGIQLCGDILHLFAAGAWLGALLGLILMVVRPASGADLASVQAAHRALAGFAGIGSAIVATIFVTGTINAWFLIGPGRLIDLPETRYGQLLLAKLTVFGGMLGLAALNRFRLTPALELALAQGKPGRALAALRRSLAIEAGAAIMIFALVAWLGTLEPPASL